MRCEVLTFLLLLQSVETVSYAQIYPFDHYTSEDGLLANYVLALCNDSRGYLWIGTNDGLSVYDGDAFRNYTVADGLAFSRVNCIIESARSPRTLWIGTNGGGVSKFENGAFRTYRIGSNRWSNLVSALLEDQSGTLWCGTVDGLYKLVDDAFEPFPPLGHVGTVLGIVQSPEGSLWVAAADRLFLLSPHGAPPRRVNITLRSGDTFESIFVDGDSTVWLGTAAGDILQLRRERIVYRTLIEKTGISFFMDDHDRFLVGTAKGVYSLGKKGTSAYPLYSRATGLPEDITSTGLCDREGNLWFGLQSKGVAKLANRSVVTVPFRDMTFAPNGSSGAVDGQGHLWIVSPNGLTEMWKRKEGSWATSAHAMRQASQRLRPSTVLVESASRLWVGYENGDIASFAITGRDQRPSSLKPLQHWKVGSGYPRAAPLFMFLDRDGLLWCSMSNSRGVYLFDPNRKGPLLRIYTADDGMPDNSVRAIFEDRDGNLWFGGYDNGLIVLSSKSKLTGRGRRFTTADGLPNLSIRSMVQDSDGIIWVGTRYGGLASFRDSAFHAVALKEGLLSTAVWSMTVDAEHRHWIGTQLGLQEMKTAPSISFSSKKELAGHPVYACGEIGQGVLWLVTDAGLIFYDSAHDRPDTASPPIYISHLRVNGIETVPRAAMEFGFDENNLTIDVIGISFRDEKSVRYQYRLVGSDTSWSSPTEHHSVVFATLSPGSYTFMARALNRDGIVSAQPVNFYFTILPPLWRRWWFVGLSILIVGGVMFLIVRSQVGRLLEIERIRSRIATDLHDDVGAGLTRIAILSSVAERELLRRGKGAEARRHGTETLKKIGDTARELVDTMSDVVWSLEWQDASLERLVNRLRSFAMEACDAANIAVRFSVDQKVMALRFTPEGLRNILLCAKEAVTNVVRHSRCTQASVDFALRASALSLTVVDNGMGFPSNLKGEGRGLGNMRKRAERAGGSFSLTSAPGRGTQIQAVFPAAG